MTPLRVSALCTISFAGGIAAFLYAAWLWLDNGYRG